MTNSTCYGLAADALLDSENTYLGQRGSTPRCSRWVDPEGLAHTPASTYHASLKPRIRNNGPHEELGRRRAATLVVFFVNGLGIGAWSAAIPPLKLAFALSDGRLSLILLAPPGRGALHAGSAARVAPRFAPTGVTTSRAALAYTLFLALPLFAPNAFGARRGGVRDGRRERAARRFDETPTPASSSGDGARADHVLFHAGVQPGLAGAGVGAAFLGFGASASVFLSRDRALGFGLVSLASRALGSGERRDPSSALGWPARAFFAYATIGVPALSVRRRDHRLERRLSRVHRRVDDVRRRRLRDVFDRDRDGKTARRSRGRPFRPHARRVGGGADRRRRFALAAASPHIVSLLSGYAMVGAGSRERRSRPCSAPAPASARRPVRASRPSRPQVTPGLLGGPPPGSARSPRGEAFGWASRRSRPAAFAAALISIAASSSE